MNPENSRESGPKTYRPTSLKDRATIALFEIEELFKRWSPHFRSPEQILAGLAMTPIALQSVPTILQAIDTMTHPTIAEAAQIYIISPALAHPALEVSAVQELQQDYSGIRWTINEANWRPLSLETTGQWPGTSPLHAAGGPLHAYDFVARVTGINPNSDARGWQERGAMAWLDANKDHVGDGGYCRELEAIGYLEPEPNDFFAPELKGFVSSESLRDIKVGLLIAKHASDPAFLTFDQRSIEILIGRWPQEPVIVNIPPEDKENENWYRQIIARDGDYILVTNFPSESDPRTTLWLPINRVKSAQIPKYVGFRNGLAVSGDPGMQEQAKIQPNWINPFLDHDLINYIVYGTPVPKR